MNKYCYFLIFLFCILFSELHAQTFSHDANSDISLPGDARGMCLKENIIYVVAGKTIYKYDLHKKEGTTLISGLSTPFDVDVNNDGKIYIAERGQNRVSIYNADGCLLISSRTGCKCKISYNIGRKKSSDDV